MAAITIIHDDFLVLEVHHGSCRRLQRTDEHILVPKKCIPDEFTMYYYYYYYACSVFCAAHFSQAARVNEEPECPLGG